MHQLTKLLLLSLLFCLLPSEAIAQKSVRRTRTGSPPRIICAIASVPKGMVVVSFKRNSACSGGTELLVKRAENGDIICAESPLPPGFAIATEAQGNLVGTCPTKAFLISGASAGRTSERRTSVGRTSVDATSVGRARERRTASFVDDDPIARAFASSTSNIQVEGEGTVISLLADDLNAPRHQRFIVELASGQTLLITHNIDIAPRIDRLQVGDSVRFSGEYIWNAKGGLLHWTHHDPGGRHVAGWLVHNGKTYR